MLGDKVFSVLEKDWSFYSPLNNFLIKCKTCLRVKTCYVPSEEFRGVVEKPIKYSKYTQNYTHTKKIHLYNNNS